MVKKSASNSGELGSIPGSRRSLGEGNGYHSSILAGRIPWTEAPGGLQSIGSQRVGHDWAAICFQILFICTTEQLFPDIVHYIYCCSEHENETDIFVSQEQIHRNSSRIIGFTYPYFL